MTVDVDPALSLDEVSIDIQGGQRQPIDKSFPVKTAGTPPAVTPVVWEIVVSKLSASFHALVTAKGLRTGSNNAVVTAIAGADVVSAQRIAVTLILSKACEGISCPTGQTCAGGTCGDIPGTGPSVDGGTRDGQGGAGGSSHLTDADSTDAPRADAGTDSSLDGGTRDGQGGAGGSSHPTDADAADAPRADAGSGDAPHPDVSPPTDTSSQPDHPADGSMEDGAAPDAARDTGPACAGQTMCSTGCADLANDGNNCGTCSHSCLGGMCSNATCLPVTLANLATGSRPAGLALNGSTVFMTVPSLDGFSPWSLYGVPKTAVNSSPSPILTSAVGNNTSGFLGASDSILFVETGSSNPGGSASTIISCSPTTCAGTQQNWYTSNDSVSACDTSAKECFVSVSGGTFSTIRFAKQGTASQTAPQDFSPVLNMASGVGPVATSGYFYMAGVYGNPTSAVLQRISEDGTTGISTLANLGPAAQFGLDGPLIVTGTRVYVVGGNITANTTGLISVSLPNGVGNSAPPFLAGTTMSSNDWVAAWGDDVAIYFSSSGHQWVTCPASGCAGSPTVLSDATGALPFLIGDAQAIYWISTTTDPNTGFTTGFSLKKISR